MNSLVLSDHPLKDNFTNCVGYLQLISGSYNESDGSYKINLKPSHLHLASRGFKDNIADVEYSQGKMRIGLRANGIPVNIFVDLI